MLQHKHNTNVAKHNYKIITLANSNCNLPALFLMLLTTNFELVDDSLAVPGKRISLSSLQTGACLYLAIYSNVIHTIETSNRQQFINSPERVLLSLQVMQEAGSKAQLPITDLQVLACRPQRVI